MPIKSVEPAYRCSQPELYEVTRIVTENLKNDRTAFAAKKPKYTVGFITGLETLRTNAMALPDDDSRDAVHQVLKNMLPGLVVPVKDNFNDVKGYIRDGWPGEDPKPRYEAAGLIRYNNIKTQNWEEVPELNIKMKSFIADFGTELATPGGMPGTFAAKVDADALAFDTKYQLFMVSKDTTTARNAKITADNILYKAIMDVCKDGKEMIYRTDEGGRKRYTFEVILKSVSAPGQASLTVTAKNADDTLVLDADITIKLPDQPALTGKILNGKALFSNIKHGNYRGHAIINGQGVDFEKEVDVGTDARITIKGS